MICRCRFAVWIVLLFAAAPASAQVDLTGTWQRVGQHDNGAAREPVDLLGMPLSADGRAKALSYDIASLSATERQCQMYPPIYAIVGPFPLQFVMVPDPVTQKLLAWKILGWGDRDETMIWMDGRPHPSKYAEHTRGGFTTGTWEGTTLVAYTTHMKAGFIRKTGPPSSDQATLTSRFYRHGDILTVLAVIEDPIYLAEPEIVTKSFQLSASPISPIGPPCVSTFEGRRLGESVPHYAPEKNPFVDELTKLFHIPREAVLGGADTLYPEYRKKIKDAYVRPEPCQKDCGAPPLR